MSFVLSKILWIFAAPSGVLLMLLGLGVCLGGKYRKTGRSLCSLVFLCLLTIATLPVGEWALMPLENKYSFNPPDRVDGIVVIGGDEKPEISEYRGQPTALDSMRRHVRFAELSRTYPEAKLMFSGGPGILNPRSRVKDADVAQGILASIGVSIEEMLIESESRNTYENAQFAAKMAHPDATQNWLLVTSAYHMPRAIACFRKAGWTIYAAPTGYYTTGDASTFSTFDFARQLLYLTIAAREYVGLVSYWAMGRIDTIWAE